MKQAFIFKFFLFTIGCIVLGSCSGCSSDPKEAGGLIPPIIPEEVYNLKVDDMRLRDPFVLVDRANKLYYLHVNGGGKVKAYKSKDLKMWKSIDDSFIPQSDFWGKSDFWAPDVYLYNNKYYLFITLSAPGIKRGTSVLVSDKPEGPFAPLVNKAVTPSDWMCLDGSLFVDNAGTPWILYCHEWLDVIDGKIMAQQLSPDLMATVGEAKLLFKASEAPWVGSITSGSITGNVTDAPFIHKLDNGELVMLWSSFRKDNGKYAIGQAYSKSGSVLGPWVQDPDPLNNDDGGHAMLFKDLQNRLMISYHAPNSATEKPVIKEVYVNNGKIILTN